MSRKVFNPKKFDKNYVLIVDPVFGNEITMRYVIYGLPLLIGFLILSFAIFGKSLYSFTADPQTAINGITNFILLGTIVPTGIYFVLFAKGKDDRFVKDIAIGKAKYKPNTTIFNERTYKAEKE